MASTIKSYRLRRDVNGRDTVEVDLMKRDPGETGLDYYITCGPCDWSSDGLSPSSARKVAAALIKAADSVDRRRAARASPTAVDAPDVRGEDREAIEAWKGKRGSR